MRTPKEYIDNLKKGIITKEMLGAAIYSVNKRAKNCRDKERQYRENTRLSKRYDRAEEYEIKKDVYYDLKGILLSVVSPTCIHEEHDNRELKRRYYDYEWEYDDLYNEAFHHGEYYDREERRCVEFIDVYEKINDIRYYLFYDFGDYSFHTPISEEECKGYNLDKKEIDRICTMGRDIDDLMSVQFVNKIITLVESGDYKYVNNES